MGERIKGERSRRSAEERRGDGRRIRTSLALRSSAALMERPQRMSIRQERWEGEASVGELAKMLMREGVGEGVRAEGEGEGEGMLLLVSCGSAHRLWGAKKVKGEKKSHVV